MFNGVVRVKPCHQIWTKVCCFLPSWPKRLIMVFLPAKLHVIHVICAYFNLLYSQISWQSMNFRWKLHVVEVVACLSAIVYGMTCWYSMIKSVWFYLKIFFPKQAKVDKKIYNSFLHTCLIVCVPKLLIKWYVFDKIHSTNFIKFIHSIGPAGPTLSPFHRLTLLMHVSQKWKLWGWRHLLGWIWYLFRGF